MVREPGLLRRIRFRSAVRHPRLTSRLGLALALTFGICFVTGLFSHYIQQPASWFYWPARPVWLYRVTQGLHVATGLASIPLLGVKLWSVYPKLFTWPPFRGLAHLVERLSLLLLVSAALFQLATGVLNISLWYTPMGFHFPTAHYWTAWIAVGSIAAHIGVKLPIVTRSLRRVPERPVTTTGITRRGLLAATGLAVGTVTIATAGQTVPGIAPVSPLAPRRPRTGPQGVPVNRTALAAGIVAAATDPVYRLTVQSGDRSVRLSLAELAAMPQHTVSLPITCVEGWSADGLWTGVRLSDLLALVGARDATAAAVESLETNWAYRASTVDTPHLRDPATLVALRLHGEPLHLDHGYPCRLIAPNRPGVMQTKWLATIRAVSL